MKNPVLEYRKFKSGIVSVNTLVIGTGAAALNAAVALHRMGVTDILILSENRKGGTSRNAGSDKQTYYKVSLSGDTADSGFSMAQDLFSGQCMHGDIALCEAQGSAKAFMNLVNLGVPFPENEFGAFPGYKTDHDPKARATSAGPYTSRMMVEALEAEVKRRKIKILGNHRVVSFLTSGEGNEKKVTGAIAINLGEKNPYKCVNLVNCVNIIMGTGGPAGLFADSVYPHSQNGTTGMAFEAGAPGQNLTEWQFGIASVKFRWNLSGSYQQVIPRYFSTDQAGEDPREFLNGYFPDLKTAAKAIFLKGYQWPFDPRKIEGFGSSLIDLIVFRERVLLGRRVWLDFTKNPSGKSGEALNIKECGEEVYSYLENSGATGSSPIERLAKMNRPAIDLYLDHGIDLSKEPLEIAVCAQHNNGGLKANRWWESDLKHLFPVGEVNGTHGVYRPGGSALNSGQVGGHRAAYFIGRRYSNNPPDEREFLELSREQAVKKLEIFSQWLEKGKNGSASEMVKLIKSGMSQTAAILRDPARAGKAAKDALVLLKNASSAMGAGSARSLAANCLALDLCLTQYVYLSAIDIYLSSGGRSRGSYLVTDKKGKTPWPGAEEEFRYTLCDYTLEPEKSIIEIALNGTDIVSYMASVRPVPEQDLWFERVWKKNLDDNLAGS